MGRRLTKEITVLFPMEDSIDFADFHDFSARKSAGLVKEDEPLPKFRYVTIPRGIHEVESHRGPYLSLFDGINEEWWVLVGTKTGAPKSVWQRHATMAKRQYAKRARRTIWACR